MLKPESMQAGHFNVVDSEKFYRGIELIRESLFDNGATLFSSDNLITWNKNYSFLRDKFFIDILHNPQYTLMDKSIIWRTYILLYFAERALRVPGDFMELGCYLGYTAQQVINRLSFANLNRLYYLYDLFTWKEGDEHTKHVAHDDPKMFEGVEARFSSYDFVRLIRGAVPESFDQGFPDQIAFAHIDMNHPVPEAGALRAILPRLSPGGIIILDDYGWWGYSTQKEILDTILEEHGVMVLELPTGQGLVMN